jgi:DNA-binding IclR family transcriptional regulator
VPVRDAGGAILASLSVLGSRAGIGPDAAAAAAVLTSAAERLGSGRSAR